MKETLLSFALHVKNTQMLCTAAFSPRKMAVCPLEVYLYHEESGFCLLRMGTHYHVSDQAVVDFVKQTLFSWRPKSRDNLNRHNLSSFF